MKKIENQRFTGERALFMAKNLEISHCSFGDGESPLKESENIAVTASNFEWKYPFWYSKNFRIQDCFFDEIARAGIWYSKDFSLKDCLYYAPKGFRGSENFELENIQIPNASETLWFCKNVKLKNIVANGQYFGMKSENLRIQNLNLSGDYCFDGCKNIEISDSKLLSKDAFWNCENVVIKNCFISGEYFGWNSSNVRLENCVVSSLQGFCYMKNLVMKDCRLINTTLAFEFSDAQAEILGKIDSVKNPSSGKIIADEIGEIIIDGTTDASKFEIIDKSKA